ncbi:hypothetical protein BDV59DRAFT_197188 [Aspergillus ambiguus]|uniref:cysteine-rich secreted protein n=1 Tax=Aspergillus ambiguus TaxID=176160 RepID=UPI003CCDFDB4
MKNPTQLTLLAFLLQVSSLHAREYQKNVPSFEVGTDATIIGSTIQYTDPDCGTGLQCKTTRTCATPGTVPTLTQDRKYFACCSGSQSLLGSPATAFDCCAAGHDLAGGPGVGYYCCPSGWTWDGRLCQTPTVAPSPTCSNGKVLVDGKCVCPRGQTERADGTCAVAAQTPGAPVCDSGLTTGKCYLFIGANGKTLGSGADGIYYARTDDMNFHYGKFQLCGDQNCTAGLAVNPGDLTYIRDLTGDPKTGANGGQWLNNVKDGVHIGKTKVFDNAGRFALTPWPCGKYCLGGVEQGVGPACPADTPALTFFSQDPQMCVPFELTEVPCDVKAAVNSCIWGKGGQQSQQRCAKGSCSC